MPMKMTFNLEISNHDLHSYVQDELMNHYHEIKEWKDLRLTKQEEKNIYVYAARHIESSVQNIVNDWKYALDAMPLVLALVKDKAILSDRIESLSKRLETERDLEERIASAAKFLREHGHIVKKKG
jgi:2-phosphoglycerate kinase